MVVSEKWNRHVPWLQEQSIGIEHFLGLTCDPVCGLVQIPCIERNAFGATRAVDTNMYALLSDGKLHYLKIDTNLAVGINKNQKLWQ